MKQSKNSELQGRGVPSGCDLLRKLGKKTALRLFLIVMACMSFTTAHSQEIKGIVVDEKGEPLVGASVIVVDGKEKVGSLNLATSVTLDGNYTIRVPNANFALEFRYIGYVNRVIPASDIQALSRVVLKEDANLLEEVVITGMTKMDKRLFTGAATRLNATEVKLDGVAEISRSLEGRVAGVSVQNVSGTFGTSPKIRIRGATSIYGDSKPLWVVDGVIIEDVVNVDADALSSGDAETMISSAISGLNASDIESFDILKDGSATSIYGAKAMAGVIVVTTKRGKSGATAVHYNGEFTTRLVPSYREFNIMNSQEQMGVYQELEQKGWLTFADTYRRRNSGVYGKMYQLLNEYNESNGTFGLQNTEQAKNAYLREAEMRNTDWFKELFQMSIVQNHSVSISGGNEKTNYYGSVSAMFDPGWYKDSKLSRYTTNMNLEHKLRSNLTARLKSNVSYRQQQAPGTLGRATDALYGEVSRDFDINPYSYALNTSRTLDVNEYYTRNWAPFNVIHELENNYLEYNVTDMIFQGELRWKPLKSLELAAMGAIKYSGSSYEHHVMDESNQALAYRAMDDAYVRAANGGSTGYLYNDPDFPYALPVSILPEGGIYERTDNRMNGYDFRLTADWNVGNDIHLLKVFGGMELNAADKNKTWFKGWGRVYEMGDVTMFDYRAFKKARETGSTYFSTTDTRDRGLAYFALANYSYQGKYSVNGTMRYEGSNRLGKSRTARWLPTWNLSGAWNAHEESFFESLQPVLSHSTFRMSYSLTADRGPFNVSNSQVIIKSKVAWRPFAQYQEPGLEIDGLENSELTYEKKHELNIGTDLGFLDNRLNLSADVYWRNNYDLIGPIAVMGMGGFIDKMANVADMKSHGCDIQLSVKNIVHKNFSWTTDYIYSYVNTEISSLKARTQVMDLIQGSGFGIEGYSRRALFSIPYVGLSDQGIPQFIDEDGNVSTYIDFQEKEKLAFLKYEGSAEPTMFGSFGNIFRYKNLRFNVFLTYSFGNKIRLDPVFSYYYTDLNATPKEFKNRWILPGDENVAGVLPVILSRRQNASSSGGIADSYRYAYSAYNYSTERVADGGFVRLKEVSLSYDFPRILVSKLGLSNLALKVQGTNLLLLYADSKLNGQDPEFVRSGGVSSPFAKQLTATLSLGL